MDRVRNLLALVRGQLWAVPAVFAVMATGLAYLLLGHGHHLMPPGDSAGSLFYSGTPGTARDLLSSLLSGLMTMTSMVVSITFVILALAANQLGPRLIAIFMADRQIQSVLGLFVGTVLYVILVLRTLDDSLDPDGAHHVAVTMASLLTILCLLAILFYVHKIARSIIADAVVREISAELRENLQEILPEEPVPDVPGPDGPDPAWDGPAWDGPAWPIPAGTAGYLQVVDHESLLEIACEQGIRIDVRVRAGQYLLRHGRHMVVHAPSPPAPELRKALQAGLILGTERTPAQDPEHGIRQLVEIAVRALSPGINDPFTAETVVDRLGASFEEAFGRGTQPRVLRDKQGTARLHVARSEIAGLLDAAFHPIRQAAGAYPAILIRIADVIADLAAGIRNEDQRDGLMEQLARLAETGAIGRFTPRDRQDIEARIDQARQAVIAAEGP